MWPDSTNSVSDDPGTLQTIEWFFCFTAAAYNLTRMRRLLTV
jgi:hypothetical protein